MENVVVHKHDLLTSLEANRLKHATDYEKTVVSYIETVTKIMEHNMMLVNQGTIASIDSMDVIPMAPRSHLADYDRAIKMVGMNILTEISLSASDFTNLVMDEWSWKPSFQATQMLYNQI